MYTLTNEFTSLFFITISLIISLIIGVYIFRVAKTHQSKYMKIVGLILIILSALAIITVGFYIFLLSIASYI